MADVRARRVKAIYVHPNRRVVVGSTSPITAVWQSADLWRSVAHGQWNTGRQAGWSADFVVHVSAVQQAELRFINQSGAGKTTVERSDRLRSARRDLLGVFGVRVEASRDDVTITVVLDPKYAEFTTIAQTLA